MLEEIEAEQGSHRNINHGGQDPAGSGGPSPVSSELEQAPREQDGGDEDGSSEGDEDEEPEYQRWPEHAGKSSNPLCEPHLSH